MLRVLPELHSLSMIKQQSCYILLTRMTQPLMHATCGVIYRILTYFSAWTCIKILREEKVTSFFFNSLLYCHASQFEWYSTTSSGILFPFDYYYDTYNVCRRSFISNITVSTLCLFFGVHVPFISWLMQRAVWLKQILSSVIIWFQFWITVQEANVTVFSRSTFNFYFHVF